MGKGKWLLGGLCAVGAIVAAPVVAPAAGLAMLGSSSVAGIGLLSASSATVAGTAGVAAGAAGVMAGAYKEKREQEKYNEGYEDGFEAASSIWEEKMAKLQERYEELLAKYTECQKYKESFDLLQNKQAEIDDLIEEMYVYIDRLETEISELKADAEDRSQEISYLQDCKSRIKYRANRLSA